VRLGLCTGGGDCPGLNAAIRAVVNYAIGYYGDEVIGVRDSFNGLETRPIDAAPMELKQVCDLINRGGTILGTVNYGNPFISAEEKTNRVISAYHELKLDALIVVGGDGTQDISARFTERGLKLIGVPKTIDNDLYATEVSIGFQTSVDTATDAITRLRSTAESHDRIMVLEVMGRDAGHIAIHSGIAGGADVILIPEIPFRWEAITAQIQKRKAMGFHHSVVVVAEGAFEFGGKPIYADKKASARGSQNLGGIGAFVADKLHDLTQDDTRITVLGHVQRGGSPNAYDRVLASQFATHAVDLAHQGQFGVVVGMQDGRVASMPYRDVAGKTRPLQLDSHVIHTAEALGISLGRVKA
jgi:phosphofructokinase-like protein